MVNQDMELNSVNLQYAISCDEMENNRGKFGDVNNEHKILHQLRCCMYADDAQLPDVWK